MQDGLHALAHARRETEACKVSALVFVGDALEESIDELCTKAGELGLCGLPVFIRGFLDFARLYRLTQARAFFVIRPKSNTAFQRV